MEFGEDDQSSDEDGAAKNQDSRGRDKDIRRSSFSKRNSQSVTERGKGQDIKESDSD